MVVTEWKPSFGFSACPQRGSALSTAARKSSLSTGTLSVVMSARAGTTARSRTRTRRIVCLDGENGQGEIERGF
jgi:lambda repressor-like predicted transcriptional regulator